MNSPGFALALSFFPTLSLLLGIITLINSLVLIALSRQVGLLHVRIQPVPALRTEEGPQPGNVLTFADPPWLWSSLTGVERILLGFVSPTCRICTPLLAAFEAVSQHCDRSEAVVLVTEADSRRAEEYLTGHRVHLPFLADPESLRSNQVPGTPFVAVVDNQGTVLAAGGVNSVEQIEYLQELATLPLERHDEIEQPDVREHRDHADQVGVVSRGGVA